ncbi:MAG: DUF3362 domain-containing protein, partial [Eubacterium sp.]
KLMQRALIQYNKSENYKLVHEALTKAGRKDLIGKKPGALIGEPGGYSKTSERDKSQGKRLVKGQKNNSQSKNKKKHGGKNGK